MFKSPSYDYIICGAGCAGLSLLMRMIKCGKFSDKKILVIDKEAKTKNDRTWCFWEKEKGFFDEIVYRKWDTVSFLSNNYSSSMSITPYQYKMIRGIDFYQYCFNEINRHSNIEVVYGDVNKWHCINNGIRLRIGSEEFVLSAGYVFSSIYSTNSGLKSTIKLLQHFKGWTIETNKPFFNPAEATIMDFRVNQQHGTTFAYVLPINSASALVEYTLFTKGLLQPEDYDKGLQDYIHRYLGIDDYQIKEEEFGVIPMTDESFEFYKNGAYHIGAAGGQTKASSGYTFQFIQKQSQQIVDYLVAGKSLLAIPAVPKRFRFYDNTLLHILYHDTLPGEKIFSQLFEKNKPQQVLRFLDNESSFGDELKIISSLPTLPFLRAALHQF